MRRLEGLLAYLRHGSLRTGRADIASDVLVLSPSLNASVDYIVRPYLSKQGLSSTVINARTSDPCSVRAGRCTAVVIVRYLFKQWLPWLREHANAGGHIIYFMDDDLMDEQALKHLPTDYARSIRKFSIRQRSTIEALCREYWVASPFLVQKYRDWNPKLIAATTTDELLRNAPGVSICYHGTSSHQAELDWLVPVVKGTLETMPTTHFEVFGDHRTNRTYRELPRVSIIHPMSWPNYVSYTSAMRRDIALAPLLPMPFNAARGITKFLDFARMRAVGVYSNVEPYRDFVNHGIDGLLVENDHHAWLEALAWLVENPERRQSMAAAAMARAEKLACC